MLTHTQTLFQLTTVEQRSAILQVLGQVHISDATDDEDLKAKEEVKVGVEGSANAVMLFYSVCKF